MKIHKCGIKIIIGSFVILLSINYLLYSLLEDYSYTKMSIQFFSLSLFVLIVFFFRNPQRRVVQNPYFIFAPADGKIIAIERVYENEYFNKEMLMISIFMSIFNVHKNWLPTSGKVLHVQHYDGKFKIAHKPTSYLDNEHNVVAMKNILNRDILIRQVAGKIARRICCYLSKNQQVKQGDDLGFIKFGSRVDVVLPLDAKPRVKIGQKVYGLLTVLADLYE